MSLFEDVSSVQVIAERRRNHGRMQHSSQWIVRLTRRLAVQKTLESHLRFRIIDDDFKYRNIIQEMYEKCGEE